MREVRAELIIGSFKGDAKTQGKKNAIWEVTVNKNVLLWVLHLHGIWLHGWDVVACKSFRPFNTWIRYLSLNYSKTEQTARRELLPTNTSSLKSMLNKLPHYMRDCTKDGVHCYYNCVEYSIYLGTSTMEIRKILGWCVRWYTFCNFFSLCDSHRHSRGNLEYSTVANSCRIVQLSECHNHLSFHSF